MSQTSGLSDQSKKIIVGAAVATATVGAGYLAYQLWRSPSNDLTKELENIKLSGNNLFKEKNYQAALKEFTRGIKLGEEKSQNGINPLVAMLYQNRAACREIIGENSFDILNDCLSALKHDRKYAKAYLRAAKHLSTVGKKNEALAYVLAAFTLDSSLNKSNFDFFDGLINIDTRDCEIQQVPGIDDRVPAPLALFRIQQWWDTWDIMDLFKKDAIAFTPNKENQEEINYRLALDCIKNGKYEEILQILNNDDISFLPAKILRAKFLSYSVHRTLATQNLPEIEIQLNKVIENIEDENRIFLLKEAFDILKLETFDLLEQVDNYIQTVTNESEKERRFNLLTFAAIIVYNGCVIDTSASSHEEQMLSDTKNTTRLLKSAEEIQKLTPHTKIIQNFVNMCSTNDYGELHKLIREMEESVKDTPTHFILLLMTKVYLMTGNAQSAEALLKEAAKIETRFLVAARLLQSADTFLQKNEEERAKGVTACAKAAIELDEFNHSAHILLLLNTNGPEPSITRKNYEEGMHHIQNAALFAPPRELLMLKRMVPLMNGKKKAAELLNIY